MYSSWLCALEQWHGVGKARGIVGDSTSTKARTATNQWKLHRPEQNPASVGRRTGRLWHYHLVNAFGRCSLNSSSCISRCLVLSQWPRSDTFCAELASVQNYIVLYYQHRTVQLQVSGTFFDFVKRSKLVLWQYILFDFSKCRSFWTNFGFLTSLLSDNYLQSKTSLHCLYVRLDVRYNMWYKLSFQSES